MQKWSKIAPIDVRQLSAGLMGADQSERALNGKVIARTIAKVKAE